MDGQCYARPTVTFLAAGHHRPLTGTKSYCLVTAIYEHVSRDCYLKAEWQGVESATVQVISPVL